MACAVLPEVGVLNCNPLHFMFAGARGTGMTTVRRILGARLPTAEYSSRKAVT